MVEISEERIKERYQEVKEKVEFKQFHDEIREVSKRYDDSPYFTEDQVIDLIVNKYSESENLQQIHSEIQKISSLIDGNGNVVIQGRLIAISNIKTFKTKAGKDGKVANLTVEDSTGRIRVVMWTDSMKYMKRITEGDVVKINNLDVQKSNFSGDLEVVMRSNSSIQVLPDEVDDTLPEYEAEKITNLADVEDGQEYNVIGRIIKIGQLREIQKPDKTLNLITLTIMDATATMELTLWNKDTQLVETLELKENDTIKVLKARAKYSYEKMSLSSSWKGRIIKGDYDLPEYKKEILKLADAQPQEDVTVIGVITRIFDTITFQKNDGNEGHVRTIQIMDDTDAISVTLWNKETEIAMNKGDIIKIEDAKIEEHEYNGMTSLRVNTGWNASIVINPEIDDEDLKAKLTALNKYEITKIVDALDVDKEEGLEVDVIGRILTIADIHEFDRMDGTQGQVRNITIADETGSIRVSLWDKVADINQSLGDAIKIESARTKVGDRQMELNVGGGSRITTPTDDEISTLPTYEELEDARYKTKTLKELEAGDVDVKLKVRVMDIDDVRLFARDDGSDGKVRSVYIADKTEQLQMSLWNEASDISFTEGAAIVVENPRITMRDLNGIQVSANANTIIRQATQDEAQDIPSIHELKNIIYPEKAIEDIEDNDKHIKVKATIEEIDGENILTPMCPTCHKGVKQDEEGYVCDRCGEAIMNPDYLLIIKATLSDGTGTINATFFGSEAEELIAMTKEKVIEVFEKTGDESSLADKIEDLISHEVTMIADAKYNDYDEDIDLTAKNVEVVV